LVTALPDGAAKTALVARLAVVQAAIDAAEATALANSRDAGIMALNAYVAAGGLSTNVLYTNLLSALFANPAVLANITSATTALNAATTALINLTAATAAVVAAEAVDTQASVDTASALVTALPDGAAKTALVARLAVVQAAIDAAIAAAALAAATDAVVAAETSSAQADVTSASALVTALPDGNAKTALVARLAVVQAAIDAAIAAAALAAATAAVVAAEAAVTQVSVNSATTLVNALPAGVAKTALLGRLATVQAAVTAATTPPVPVNTVAGAPTGVSATAGNAIASVSWTAPTSNGGAAITDYIVEYSNNNGSTWTVFSDGVSTATTATVTGLVNGTAYIFRIKAVNAVGNSAASAGSAAVTPVAPVVIPVEKSASTRTKFSNNATSLSAKQKAGLRAYFENYATVKSLEIEVIAYSKSANSTRESLAAATARARAVVAFLKTLGIEAKITSKSVGKGTDALAVLNLKWLE